jgi:cell division ATPase FtsA
MILSEAARGANSNGEVEQMTTEEVNRLIESAVTKATREAQAPLRERLLKADATNEAVRLLEGVALPPKAKELIIENVLGRDIPMSGGELDTKKFRESVDAEMQRVGAVVSELTGSGRVFTMGQSTEPTEKQLKEAKRDKKAAKEARKGAVSIFESLGMSEEAAKIAARGREVA